MTWDGVDCVVPAVWYGTLVLCVVQGTGTHSEKDPNPRD